MFDLVSETKLKSHYYNMKKICCICTILNNIFMLNIHQHENHKSNLKSQAIIIQIISIK